MSIEWGCNGYQENWGTNILFKNSHVIYECSLNNFLNNLKVLNFLQIVVSNTIHSHCMIRGSISLVVHAAVWKLWIYRKRCIDKLQIYLQAAGTQSS